MKRYLLLLAACTQTKTSIPDIQHLWQTETDTLDLKQAHLDQIKFYSFSYPTEKDVCGCYLLIQSSGKFMVSNCHGNLQCENLNQSGTYLVNGKSLKIMSDKLNWDLTRD